MGIKLNNYAVNQAEKGSVIYDANEQINSVCIILKGRVLAINGGSKVCLASGSFLGVSDLYIGRYLNSYVAFDDVTFYCFPIQNADELVEIFGANKDYKGILVASLTRYINELDKIYNSLTMAAARIYEFTKENYSKYTDACQRFNQPVGVIPVFEEIEEYASDFVIDEKKIQYYKSCAKISLDVWKAFCSVEDTVALYLVEETAGLIIQLTTECNFLSSYISGLFDGLINKTDTCLFKNFAALAITADEKGWFNNDIVQVLDDTIDQINAVEKLFDEKVGNSLFVDRGKMEEIYYLLLSKDRARKEQVETNFLYSQEEVNKISGEVNNSLKQIIAYGNFDSEKGEELEKSVADFLNLRDKFSTDDESRVIRKRIALYFYDLYEAVFLRAYKDKQTPKIIDLFLRYGFLDERALTKDQIKELYFMEDKEPEIGPCPVYNIKDWLTQIYEGKKEPSKNEFDLEYVDALRDRKKRGDITEAEEKELLSNSTEKVKYEIHNLFRYNHRIVNGQISTFVPFLWGDNIVRSLNSFYVTAAKLNEAVKELLEIDYSAFYREVLYVNAEKGIVKEYIMAQVFPDVILMPTLGTNSAMWQEISGKKRSNPGRFVFPVFSEGALKDLLIKAFARFRWELCRSIQGTAWNNIKYKSLTSEYADYIQFYRKNRDLSEEMKEKIKSQIQRGRGNYRETFVIDYEAWMKGEANGSLRVNRVVRSMLATYCPFGKPIRERLKGQPLFAEAYERFQRNTLKKIRDLELRFRAIEKDGGEITEELMETLIFYRDM